MGTLTIRDFSERCKPWEVENGEDPRPESSPSDVAPDRAMFWSEARAAVFDHALEVMGMPAGMEATFAEPNSILDDLARRLIAHWAVGMAIIEAEFWNAVEAKDTTPEDPDAKHRISAQIDAYKESLEIMGIPANSGPPSLSPKGWRYSRYAIFSL